MTKRKLFICILSAAVLINIIPLLIFKDKAAVSKDAWFTIIIMAGVSINGVSSFFLRHKGNYLSIAYRPSILTLFSEDKERTFTEEYEKEFFWQFCVYWFAVPFFLPCIFFDSGKWWNVLWPMCVFLVPQLVYFIYDIIYSISNGKKAKKELQIIKQKQEQELKEQKLREELGHYK